MFHIFLIFMLTQAAIAQNMLTIVAIPVINDPDTACALSVAEVSFYSALSAHNTGNEFRVQLSDASGSFAAPVLAGQLPSSKSYSAGSPGIITGQIPAVAAGCNYYIRLVSTSPSLVGDTLGPFCIKHCDIITNSNEAVHVCIEDDIGGAISVGVLTDAWNGHNIIYHNGNRFSAQLLYKNTLQQVSLAQFGAVLATGDTVLTVRLPSPDSLLNAGVAPGVYYLRIVADSSSHPWNSAGTLIEFTLGVSYDPPQITSDKSIFCNHEIAELQAHGGDTASQFEWYSPVLNNGDPFFWESNPLRVDFTAADTAEYVFRVREFSYGCASPYSIPLTVSVTLPPDTTLSRPDHACLGFSETYSVPYVGGSHYEWGITGGLIVDSVKNQVTIELTSLTAELSLYALNMCGVYNKTYPIQGSPCTGIAPVNSLIQNVFPNPAANMLHIETNTSAPQISTLQLLNATGKPVLAATRALQINNTITLDVSGVPNGIYMLQADGVMWKVAVIR